MDDLPAWAPQSNGATGDGNPQPPSPQQSNPEPSAISAESWRLAEQATQEVIQCIQPTVISEQRRRAVVEYVQKLIRTYLATEIFPFGSVPLKTYLPDGDIDLTALSMPNSEDVLANEVHSVLEVEEQNKDAKFEVKDVQYIHAEVKLVKCIVQNIVVDISFNQIGGLCTLCFLEQVDNHIGKDHLFKRSIILIKAWCYYESRILGAHHGLISTYALETLVLYIFHLFHKSLDGPLVVLYRFLDYYSKFDWDNYCISLHGPIPISSLPELVAEPPETHESDLLLSKEFLKQCVDMFSVPSRGSENNSRIFSQKHLNIVDPLKESNNLGRSVSKGNFHRIRSAFTYGARKLGRILLLPAENMADEVTVFFTNTLERHGSSKRPDVQGVFPSHSDRTMIDHDGLGSISSDLKVEKCDNNKLISESVFPSHSDRTMIDHDGLISISSDLKFEKCDTNKLISGSTTTNSCEALSEKINNINISVSEEEDGTITPLSRHPFNQHLETNWLRKCSKTEPNNTMEGNVVSGKRLAGDARDLATRRASDLRVVSENYKVSPSSSETGSSPSGKAYHAPHLFFHPENGARGEVIDQANSTNLGAMNKVSATRAPAPDEEFVQSDFCETKSSRSGRNHVNSMSAGSVDGPVKSSWNTCLSEDSHLAEHLISRYQRNGNNKSPKFNDLSDLAGDYDLHIRNLLYARECQDFFLGSSFIPLQQLSPYYRNKNSWHSFNRQNMYAHMGANGAIPGPPFSPPGCYLLTSPIMSSTYGMEDLPKPRGTGMYFPNMSFHSYRERPSLRGRNSAAANNQPRSRSNARVETSTDVNLKEESSQESPSQAQVPIFSGNGRGKPAPLDLSQWSRTASKGGSHVNGFVYPPEGKLAFGSFGAIPVEVSSPERGSRMESFGTQGSGPAIPVTTEQRSQMGRNRERPTQPYQLKDEVDFPPLAS